MPSGRILISGASGLVGSLLAEHLKVLGYRVTALTRSRRPDSILWDPENRSIEREKLSGFDALINLAGENIAARRWNPRFKKEIYASRAQSTEFLIESLAESGRFPRVFISASAVGYYGDAGEEEVTEDRPAGGGFLSEVCRAWEAAAQGARAFGARVICMRLGVVLNVSGGALARMLPVFRLGLGGRIGSGRQWMSWISSADLCAAVEFILKNDSLSGAVNLVSPEPVRNIDFARLLAAILRRPAVFPLPAFAARLIFGQLAQETILRSTRALPARLSAEGYHFSAANLLVALKHELYPR